MKRTLALLALLLAAALTLAGCGGDGTGTDGTGDSSPTAGAGDSSRTGGAAAGDFNEADVAFAQGMIPHHQQAVQMAAMAQARASSPQVRRLAGDIESAQAPEIETMRGWLDEWGEDGSAGSTNGGHGMGGMDMGDMPGLMSQGDMRMLRQGRGADWDRMFLTMMVGHHQSAIEMARTEVADGQNPDAVALAEKIIEDQQAEIEKMQQMLR